MHMTCRDSTCSNGAIPAEDIQFIKRINYAVREDGLRVGTVPVATGLSPPRFLGELSKKCAIIVTKGKHYEHQKRNRL